MEDLDILSSRDRDYISKRLRDVDAHEDQWLPHPDVTTLRMAENVSWKDQMTNTEIRSNIVSEKIKTRRLTLAGYHLPHTELSVSKVIACVPSHGSLTRHDQAKEPYRGSSGEMKEELVSYIQDRVLCQTSTRFKSMSS